MPIYPPGAMMPLPWEMGMASATVNTASLFHRSLAVQIGLVRTPQSGLRSHGTSHPMERDLEARKTVLGIREAKRQEGPLPRGFLRWGCPQSF